MVGYNKHDVLTSNQKLMAGCISGVVTRFVTQPLDVVKLRTQLQKSRKKQNSLWIIRKILKEEGLIAFWHGHTLGQVHSVLSVSTQFYVYEISTKYMSNIILNKRSRSFICGVCAGCTSATFVCPLEVIRVRQMILKQQYSSFIIAAKEVYKYGGILGFYEGLNASLLQVGPSSGITFAVFSFTQPKILHYLAQRHEPCTKECSHAMENSHHAEDIIIASSISASLAGFISKTTTYPFDLAKRRLQIASHQHHAKYQVPSSSKNLFRCKTLFECLRKTVARDGVLGLYQGWPVTVYKAQLTSIVAFTTYESVCYMIREIVT